MSSFLKMLLSVTHVMLDTVKNVNGHSIKETVIVPLRISFRKVYFLPVVQVANETYSETKDVTILLVYAGFSFATYAWVNGVMVIYVIITAEYF